MCIYDLRRQRNIVVADGFSRLFSKCGATGGAARPFKQASPNAVFHPLFVPDRLADDAYPFNMMSETILHYIIILCVVGGQRRGLDKNVKNPTTV